MKYVVLIADGAAGLPVDEFGGRTSLETASIPHLDRMAREGTMGLSYTVPPGMEPSSAIACMSVLGFDPTLYYAGRGPIEAMAMGIRLEPGQAAMRCNLVTVLDGIMVSYAAGNITSAEARVLMEVVQDVLGSERLQFYPGVGFRQILTVRQGEDLLDTVFTAPHDLADKPVAGSEPVGPAAELMQGLMDASRELLHEHPINQARIARGLPPATQIWPFWPGLKPVEMPSFAEAYGRVGALTSGVDLLRGLAVQTGLVCLDILGVTDEGDNDYAGQMAGALQALDTYDVVFVHVEAPDEASHAGNAHGKVAALENIDALMVAQVIARKEAGDDLRLLVMPDHPTPLALRTHLACPVPFVMWGTGVEANGASAFTEKEALAIDYVVAPGYLLLQRFLGDSCNAKATG